MSEEVEPTPTDIASTLCARDYKGSSYRDAKTVVAVYEDTDKRWITRTSKVE